MTMATPATPAPDLRIRSLFSRSWRAFKTRPWFLVGATLVGNLLMPFLTGFVLGYLRYMLFPKGAMPDHILNILVTLGNLCFVSGLMIISMRVWLGEDTSFGMIFAGFRRFWRILGLCLVGIVVLAFGVIVLGLSTALVAGAPLGLLAVAMILLGVYFGIAFGPALLVILETRLGVFAALRLSWNLTRGHWWSLFLAVLASTVFGVAGVLALGVGLLVSLPVCQLMLMVAYDELARSYAARAEAAAAAPDEAQAAQA